ncbi:hypothetical protein [Nocardioides humilatus]|nr:hypothetical protein [Nocardioides humilatus]
MKRPLAVVLLLAGLLSTPTPVASAAAGGDLDRSFGTNGVTKDPAVGVSGRAVALQSNGRIVVVGYSGYWAWVYRYRTDGTLDTSFGGGDGRVNIDFGHPTELNDVAIQSDGRIMVVGRTHIAGLSDYYDTAVARLTSSGDLDTTFRGDGKSVLDLGFRDGADAVAIAPNGRIVIVGDGLVKLDGDFYVTRLTSSGALDSTFSSNGRTTTGFGGENDAALDVAVQSDGRIVVAGRTDADGEYDYDFAVARYTTSGGLDASFNFDGKASIGFGDSDEARAVAIQSDGKIVLAGPSDPDDGPSDFAVARLNAVGLADDDWDGDGKITTGFGGTDDWAEDVLVQPDGRIVVVGRVRTDKLGGPFDLGLLRYNQSGSLNTSFGGDGKVRTNLGTSDEIYGIARQTDGKLVVAGEVGQGADPQLFVARFHWTTDPAPTTTIDSGPSGDTADTTPTFTFHSNESGAKFECTVATPYVPCTSPKTFTLAPGSYTFKVRAIDSSAQKDATPATRSFTILTP